MRVIQQSESLVFEGVLCVGIIHLVDLEEVMDVG